MVSVTSVWSSASVLEGRQDGVLPDTKFFTSIGDEVDHRGGRIVREVATRRDGAVPTPWETGGGIPVRGRRTHPGSCYHK